jgi:hypothetical protein
MASSKVPAHQQFATQRPLRTEAAEVVNTQPVNQQKPRRMSVGTVAAAGNSQGTAAALPDSPVVSVTAADGTKGVILPANTGSNQEIVIHNVANAILKVYPPTGGDINDGTQNAAADVAAKTQARFFNLDGVTWSASGVS